MDETREYGLNRGYGPSQPPKVSVNNVEEDDDDDEVEDDGEEELYETNVRDNELNETSRHNGNDDEDGNQYDEDDDEDNQQRHPKKRKLKSLLSSYEFAPRVPPPTSARKPSFGGRNTLTDWSEHETFVLLDAWDERYVKCGRKSLRSEEWLEVADRVNQESKIERTDSQCRNRLDTLKKKYKKEKASLIGGRIINTKWVYFKKMDMLLSPGGNAAFIKPSVNRNNTNGVAETKGTIGTSYSHDDEDEDDDDDDDSDLLPPKKLKPISSFKLLADSINKFSEIYEKIENHKIQQMIELEKMKMDFHKELELQKRQILDRARAEITKAQQGDYEDHDVSAENISG